MARRKRIKNLEDILEAARNHKRIRKLAVASAEEDSVLKSVSEAAAAGMVKPLLVGDQRKIKRLARSLRISLKDTEIINRPDPVEATHEAVRLCHDNEADVLMKGAVNTDVVLKAALNRETGLSTGKLISHVAVFCSPRMKRVMLLSDAAININPDVSRKVEIIQNAIWVAERLGINNPKVALLAAVEKIKLKDMPATTDAAIITRMNESGQIPGAVIGGPYALDLAISENAAKTKHVKGSVAGKADILIAPDINCANVLYKSLVYFAGLEIASAVIGTTSPIVVTSRSDSPETKLHTIALSTMLVGKKPS